MLDPNRPVERRPRRTSGTGKRGTARAAPGVSASRGPYASAGPYDGGAEVRLERVPGGLRLARWQAGQIDPRAPELGAADLPGLLADAAGKGLIEVSPGNGHDGFEEGAYGASRGRAGELRDELRVERLDDETVRIARWVLRPGSGWQLQEAPVMLPAGRFKEAIERAAERGVLGGAT